MDFSSNLNRLCENLDSLLERKTWLFPLVFSAIFLPSAILVSAAKPFGFDELATYLPATLPTASAVVQYYLDGIDVHTPLASLLVRFSMAAFGQLDVHVTARILAFTGYWIMCLLLYVFVRRLSNALYGAAAACFVSITSVSFYITESRAYGLLLGLTALAMVCYQNLNRGQSRAWSLPGLALSLSLAMWCHYYAVFLYPAFGIAEIWRSRQRRRIDWPLWFLLLLSPLPVLYMLPGIQAARAVYASGIWSRPSPSQIEGTYRFLLTLAFFPVNLAVFLWLILQSPRRQEAISQDKPLNPEILLAAIIAAMPVYAVPLSAFAGGYVERYALPTIVGLAATLAVMVSSRTNRDSLLGMILLATFGGWFLIKTPGNIRKYSNQLGGLASGTQNLYSQRFWMPPLEQSTLPVAVTPAVFFWQFQHYASPALKSRLYYPASIKEALRLEGMDTGDQNLLQFARRFPLQVPQFEAFLATNKRFLLLAYTLNPTWHIEILRERGATLRLIRRQENEALYEVEVSTPAP